MNIGARIKELRIEQKITQDRLSEYLGTFRRRRFQSGKTGVPKLKDTTLKPTLTLLP